MHAIPTLQGEAMGWPWALPFAGLLLTIAIGPLVFPRMWHLHYGKLAAAWALLTLVPLGLAFGVSATLARFVHAMLAEYMSFIILLFALYTVAGGLLVTSNFHGRPVSNTLMLGFGAVIASIVGTTGAAMILVRPLIRANVARKHNAHVVVFFIFLVANIGGALSPLGDPPLFVGFLHGVDFFWPVTHLWRQTLIAAALLLAVFAALLAPRTAGRGPKRPHPYPRPNQPAVAGRNYRRDDCLGALEVRHRRNGVRHRAQGREHRPRKRRAMPRALA
jgi:Na+/H+ antiporter NhaD/arsenite permease-like protein